MNYKRLFLENTYVFITIVTYNRSKILIKNISLLRESFTECKNKYNFDIFSVVILPDHIHMIIKPENVSEYPIIVGQIKKYFTMKSNIEYKKNKSREATVWQRRYWEHTIRDENDLYRHLDYIHFNPIKHGHVKATKDWAFSSFEKFVDMGHYEKNWCNLNNEHNIICMDLE